jgi:hypothetical protein
MRTAAALNGRIFPQPPLVWRVADGELKVRALLENKRPSSITQLAVAPFWNLSESGQAGISQRAARSAGVAAPLAFLIGHGSYGYRRRVFRFVQKAYRHFRVRLWHSFAVAEMILWACVALSLLFADIAITGKTYGQLVQSHTKSYFGCPLAVTCCLSTTWVILQVHGQLISH